MTLAASLPANLPLAAGLAALAVGALAYVFLLPLLTGERRAAQRLRTISLTGGPSAGVRNAAASRRDQVAKTLNEIDAKAKGAAKVTLELKIARAGLKWSKRTYWIVSAGIGVFLAVVMLVVTESLEVAAGAGFVGVLGVPPFLLAHMRRRRIARFVAELPNAVDVVVRGIRSGIPVGDCFRMVSREAQEPVRSEFRTIVETQTLGLSLGDAVSRLQERVPVPEVNFFAIVINIQQQSGGNLSEALNNLSRVLRERRKMAGKVQAMSMEAKASAGIIASLPFGVAGITMITSPDYISLLWTTDAGKIALVGCGVWMLLGVLTIRKMIAFDF